MEIEFLSAEMEWESRRVAAALGVKKWLALEKSERELYGGIWPTIIYSGITRSNETIHFEIESTSQSFFLQIGEEEEDVFLTILEVRRSGKGVSAIKMKVRASGVSSMPSSPERSKHNHVLAHGMYCLGSKCCGFDLSCHSALNRMIDDLSTHEKLELRLSLPREFWPQMWIDEESA